LNNQYQNRERERRKREGHKQQINKGERKREFCAMPLVHACTFTHLYMHVWMWCCIWASSDRLH